MINKTEWNRMMEGKLYNPYKVGDNSFENVHAAQKKFNESEYWNDKSAFEELKKCSSGKLMLFEHLFISSYLLKE